MDIITGEILSLLYSSLIDSSLPAEGGEGMGEKECNWGWAGYRYISQL